MLISEALSSDPLHDLFFSSYLQHIPHSSESCLNFSVLQWLPLFLCNLFSHLCCSLIQREQSCHLQGRVCQYTSLQNLTWIDKLCWNVSQSRPQLTLMKISFENSIGVYRPADVIKAESILTQLNFNNYIQKHVQFFFFSYLITL